MAGSRLAMGTTFWLYVVACLCRQPRKFRTSWLLSVSLPSWSELSVSWLLMARWNIASTAGLVKCRRDSEVSYWRLSFSSWIPSTTVRCSWSLWTKREAYRRSWARSGKHGRYWSHCETWRTTTSRCEENRPMKQYQSNTKTLKTSWSKQPPERQ